MVRVRFSHPWTDTETGTSYYVGQVVDLDDEVAAVVTSSGWATVTTDGIGLAEVDHRFVTHAELTAAFAAFTRGSSFGITT